MRSKWVEKMNQVDDDDDDDDDDEKKSKRKKGSSIYMNYLHKLKHNIRDSSS
jgi:hypothetical protein